MTGRGGGGLFGSSSLLANALLLLRLASGFLRATQVRRRLALLATAWRIPVLVDAQPAADAQGGRVGDPADCGRLLGVHGNVDVTGAGGERGPGATSGCGKRRRRRVMEGYEKRSVRAKVGGKCIKVTCACYIP